MVDILLATYNGEKFIKSQILSIIYQSYQDWKLIIHDDGSSDNTIKIVKELCLIDHRIQLIEDKVICGSAAKNFMHLLQYSDSEYVMFCDQDDIWFDNKIEAMLHKIESMNNSKPRVIYSNSYVWIPEKGIKGLGTLTYASNLRQLLFLNSGTQGCVSMFDDKVCRLLRNYRGELSMHDHLLHLIAASLSNVLFFDVPLMLYRNHDKNVTGGTRTQIIEKSIFLKNNRHAVVDKMHYQTIRDFRIQYDNYLTNEDRLIMDVFLKMPYMSIFKRLFVIVKYRFKLYNSVCLLLLKSIVRPFING